MKKNISLHGSYYIDNFGDVLLCDIIKEITQNSYDCEISIPYATDIFMKMLGENIESNPRDIFKSDFILFGGGGYLGEPNVNVTYWSWRLIKRYLVTGAILRILKKPYAIYGVGAGPINHYLARKLTVFFCNGAKEIVVRDEESKDYLQRYGVKQEVKLATDMAILVEPTYISNENKNIIKEELYKFKDKKKIFLHLAISPDYKKNNMGNGVKYIINDLIKIVNTHKDVAIILGCDSNMSAQVKIANEIVSSFPENSTLILEYKNPNLLIAALNEMDIVITTKLHVGIVGTALRKNVLAFSGHQKIKRFYKQLNCSNNTLPLEELEENIAYDMITKALNESIMDNNKITEMKELANTYYREKIKEVLETTLG